MMRRIAVLGAGAWGTALALVAGRAGRDVILQAHDPQVAAELSRDRINRRYLPGIALPTAVRITADAQAAVDEADVVMLAVPAQHLRTVLRGVRAAWRPATPAVICAKGIEQAHGALMSEVVEEALPGATVAVLSGPSFAAEVACELPTAITFACADARLRRQFPAAFGTPAFRIYASEDVLGAQLGGAVKNVLAIACGIVHGRGIGENARAALITRGLAEMARFAVARGARPETLAGLSGLGDLVLTCTAMQSRNYSLGAELGRGRALRELLAERISVAEGVHTAAILVDLAHKVEVEMPICAAVDAVLNHGADLGATIAAMLARPQRAEAFAM